MEEPGPGRGLRWGVWLSQGCHRVSVKAPGLGAIRWEKMALGSIRESEVALPSPFRPSGLYPGRALRPSPSGPPRAGQVAGGYPTDMDMSSGQRCGPCPFPWRILEFCTQTWCVARGGAHLRGQYIHCSPSPVCCPTRPPLAPSLAWCESQRVSTSRG